MKRLLAMLAAVFILAGPALAAVDFPKEYAAIDAALLNSPKLSAEDLADAKRYRVNSEKYYKAGAKNAATIELQKAAQLLGISVAF